MSTAGVLFVAASTASLSAHNCGSSHPEPSRQHTHIHTYMHKHTHRYRRIYCAVVDLVLSWQSHIAAALLHFDCECGGDRR